VREGGEKTGRPSGEGRGIVYEVESAKGHSQRCKECYRILIDNSKRRERRDMCSIKKETNRAPRK